MALSFLPAETAFRNLRLAAGPDRAGSPVAERAEV
jgi:hypothetical protein